MVTEYEFYNYLKQRLANQVKKIFIKYECNVTPQTFESIIITLVVQNGKKEYH